MKNILKNLWNRRRANASLFVELIIVSILTWIMADQLVPSLYDTSLPNGYDHDRMAIISVACLPDNAPQYDAAMDSAAMREEAAAGIHAKIRAYEAVEHATEMGEYPFPGGESNSSKTYVAENPADDSVYMFSPNYMFVPADDDFFLTYGIEAEPGSPSAAELSKRNMLANNELVITRLVAETFWPGQNAVGKHLITSDSWSGTDTVTMTVVGVVNDVRWTNMHRAYTVVFNGGGYQPAGDMLTVMVRIRPGIDMDDFLAGFRDWAKSNLRLGNYYFKSAMSYNEMMDDTLRSYNVYTERRQVYLFSTFFLLSLLLGTIGCFWLQSRKRVAEIGIRRSFGARRGDIVGMILGEAVTLATLAFLTGIAIYLQFALKLGLNEGLRAEDLDDWSWISNFWQHFAIISLIVYAIIILCVVVGTLIPAVNASRVNVTDALRDE